MQSVKKVDAKRTANNLSMQWVLNGHHTIGQRSEHLMVTTQDVAVVDLNGHQTRNRRSGKFLGTSQEVSIVGHKFAHNTRLV